MMTIMQNERDDYTGVIPHKDPEDYKFMRMKMAAMQTLEKEDEEEEEEKEGAVMMCQWCHNTQGEELKKKTIRCSDDMSILSQYPWKDLKQKKRRCSPTSAPSMQEVSKDTQLACNINGN